MSCFVAGFCLIRNALSLKEQADLISDCLQAFPDPPASTNHDRSFGPLPQLWDAAQQQLFLKDGASPVADRATANSSKGDMISHNSSLARTASQSACWTSESCSLSAQTLLSKLRWVSLGPNFDWTARRYLYDQPFQALPTYLVNIGRRCLCSAREAEVHLAGQLRFVCTRLL